MCWGESALVIRPDKPKPGKKYCYLSSNNRGGPGPRAQIRVPLFDGDKTLVRITEGALKANIATKLSGLLTVGLPGISTGNRVAELLHCGATTARLAFDADASMNYHVAHALKKLADDLHAKGFTLEMETWDIADGKGIDDVLHNNKTPAVLTGAAVFNSIEMIGTEAKMVEQEKQKAQAAASTAGTAQAANAQDFHLTDLGNAKRVVAQHGRDWRYCHPFKKSFLFDGRRWAEDDTGGAVRIVKETQPALFREVAQRIEQTATMDDDERKKELAVTASDR